MELLIRNVIEESTVLEVDQLIVGFWTTQQNIAFEIPVTSTEANSFIS